MKVIPFEIFSSANYNKKTRSFCEFFYYS